MGIEDRLVAAIQSAGLDPAAGFAAEDLGALDHFHTGGRRATAELLELVALDAGARVLDIGAGLGGTARMVASKHGCGVTCLEPSEDFCLGARLLNRLTGLDSLIEVRRAAVPPVPLADESVDVVLMQNVGMCIADKRGLYRDVRRVLRSGGRFAFQEMAAGTAGEPPYPLPWADGPATNFLVAEEELERALTDAGLVRETFEDVTASELARPSTGAAQGPLTLAVYVDDLAAKARNSRQSLETDRVRMIKGVFRRP